MKELSVMGPWSVSYLLSRTSHFLSTLFERLVGFVQRIGYVRWGSAYATVATVSGLVWPPFLSFFLFGVPMVGVSLLIANGLINDAEKQDGLTWPSGTNDLSDDQKITVLIGLFVVPIFCTLAVAGMLSLVGFLP